MDDDADGLELLTDLIRKAGHEVCGAVDAETALATLEAFRPEVAVIDIGLPSMTGYELARQIRERIPCRLLALSGYPAAAAPQDTTVTCFDDHFVKPVELAVLLRAIEKAPASAV